MVQQSWIPTMLDDVASAFVPGPVTVLNVVEWTENVEQAGAPNGSLRETFVRKAWNLLRFSDLIAVKARDFFVKHHVGLP